MIAHYEMGMSPSQSHSHSYSHHSRRPSAEQLLAYESQYTEMMDLPVGDTKESAQVADRYTDNLSNGEASTSTVTSTSVASAIPPLVEYKVYKRRWFGLVQLVLLNIVVSWDVGFAVTISLPYQMYLISPNRPNRFV